MGVREAVEILASEGENAGTGTRRPRQGEEVRRRARRLGEGDEAGGGNSTGGRGSTASGPARRGSISPDGGSAKPPLERWEMGLRAAGLAGALGPPARHGCVRRPDPRRRAAKPSPKGREPYDVFRNRIMFRSATRGGAPSPAGGAGARARREGAKDPQRSRRPSFSTRPHALQPRGPARRGGGKVRARPGRWGRATGT